MHIFAHGLAPKDDTFHEGERRIGGHGHVEGATKAGAVEQDLFLGQPGEAAARLRSREAAISVSGPSLR
jgi:hypothetical protein